MKSLLFFAVGGLAIILCCYLYFFQTIRVKTELVDVQKNTSKQKLAFPYLVSHNMEELNFFLYSWLGDSLKAKKSLDFSKNDYLVTLGWQIKNASYYSHISHPNDDCEYLDKLPLKVQHQEKYTDSIYFYKIGKGKYRNLCP